MMSGLRRTVWAYYAYRITTSHGFWVPVGTLYLVQADYGLDLIGLANAVLVFAIVAAEIPAGYVGDRVGRRTTLAVGNAITVAVMASYPFLEGAFAYVVLFGVWGIGFAFKSAVGEAWLYDLLQAEADETQFARLQGRGEAAQLAFSAGAAVLAGVLYTIDPTIPFLVNAALAALGLPILVSLPTTRDHGEADPVSVTAIAGAVAAQLRRPALRWLVLYTALFNVLFSMTRWLEQPALDAVGVPVAGLGVLYAAFKLVSAGAMSLSGWVQDRVGARRFFLLLAPVIGASYAVIAVVPVAVVPVLFLRRAVDRVSGPVRNQYINDRLSGWGRATVLSGVSMALHLASGVGNVVAGRVAAVTGPVGVLPVAGVTIAVLAVGVWVTTQPVRGTRAVSEDAAVAAD